MNLVTLSHIRYNDVEIEFYADRLTNFKIPFNVNPQSDTKLTQFNPTQKLYNSTQKPNT